MLNSIKAYLLAGLSVIAAVLAALFYREKAKGEETQRKGVEKARDIEGKAVDALLEGDKREKEAINEANNSTKRDGFS